MKYCKICNKQLNRRGGNFRCRNCWFTAMCQEKNPNWKGGLIKKLCLRCNKNFKVKFYRKNNAKYCSRKCSAQDTVKYGEKHHSFRDKHWNWKGGITPTKKKLYYSLQYKNWRSKCLKRDNYICQICGERDLELNVDHQIPFARIFYTIKKWAEEFKLDIYEFALKFEPLWDIRNGRTLCVGCHKSIPTTGINQYYYESL